MRSKGFSDYLRKRDEKAARKSRKKHLMDDAKDEDDYLNEAFE